MDRSAAQEIGRSPMMPPMPFDRRATTAAYDWIGYRDVTGLSVTYITDPEKVQPLLPDGFVVGAPPDNEALVTVYYARNCGCDWLAGGDYNMLGVDVRATFGGEKDVVTGDYSLLLWENRTEPILTGRELQGIPKVHADITDVLSDGRSCWVRASKNGRPMVELTLSGLREMPETERLAAQERGRNRNWMGWRYIPKIGGPGAELSQITFFPVWPTYRTASFATGSVKFYESSFAENPTQWQFVNLLAQLEPLEYRSAFRWEGDYGADSRPVRVLE